MVKSDYILFSSFTIYFAFRHFMSFPGGHLCFRFQVLLTVTYFYRFSNRYIASPEDIQPSTNSFGLDFIVGSGCMFVIVSIQQIMVDKPQPSDYENLPKVLDCGPYAAHVNLCSFFSIICNHSFDELPFFFWLQCNLVQGGQYF